MTEIMEVAPKEGVETHPITLATDGPYIDVSLRCVGVLPPEKLQGGENGYMSILRLMAPKWDYRRDSGLFIPTLQGTDYDLRPGNKAAFSLRGAKYEDFLQTLHMVMAVISGHNFPTKVDENGVSKIVPVQKPIVPRSLSLTREGTLIAVSGGSSTTTMIDVIRRGFLESVADRNGPAMFISVPDPSTGSVS